MYDFIKGAVAGAMVGVGVALLFDPITPRQRRRAVRKANCMVHDMKKAVKSALPM